VNIKTQRLFKYESWLLLFHVICFIYYTHTHTHTHTEARVTLALFFCLYEERDD